MEDGEYEEIPPPPPDTTTEYEGVYENESLFTLAPIPVSQLAHYDEDQKKKKNPFAREYHVRKI